MPITYGVRRAVAESDTLQLCHHHRDLTRARQCARDGDRIVAVHGDYEQTIGPDGAVLTDSRSPERIAGERLAERAGYSTDEHGTYERGDHWHVVVLDYVPPSMSALAPYLDAGGEGMALIRVDRRRIYAKSAEQAPSCASSYYLCGRNEVGTFYAHPVAGRAANYDRTRPESPATVQAALTWIWSGHAADILARQGDIALIWTGTTRSGNLGALPARHVATAEGIVHPTHAILPLPARGQRIIVARRASPRVSPGTRD